MSVSRRSQTAGAILAREIGNCSYELSALPLTSSYISSVSEKHPKPIAEPASRRNVAVTAVTVDRKRPIGTVTI